VPKREAPSWELVLKRNSVERLKHDLFPTELTNQWNRLVETPYEKLPEEDIVRLQWFGMYHDKPKIGTFMMRVKIPSGILTPTGLNAIGEISESFGRDQGELTTRQNIQLHYITLDRCPEIFDRLKAAALTTMGGCGDVVRNITGCPVAGVDRDELFERREIAVHAVETFGHDPDAPGSALHSPVADGVFDRLRLVMSAFANIGPAGARAFVNARMHEGIENE